MYNVENYLEECLDSITNQTLKDIEIICINDGSTDKSLDILNEYAKKDDRFTVLSQENGGHAVATNRGMSLATGKYLYLMDSDDILSLNALEDTYKIAEEKNVDFVLFQAINYNDATGESYKQENYSMNAIADLVGDKVFNYKDLGDLIFKITVTPWTKLYNREFVVKSGAKFPEGLVFEDNVFSWEILFSAEKIAFYREHLFTRRWHSASSTVAGDKRFLDAIEVENLTWDTFKRFNEFETFKKQLYNRKVSIYWFRFSHIKEEFKELFFNEMKKNFENIHNSTYEQDFLDNIYHKNKEIYKNTLEMNSPIELELSIKNYELKEKNKKLKKQNKAILKSNSWKITKPLRSIKNKL